MIELINSIFLKNIWFFLWALIWSLYVIADSLTLGVGLLTIYQMDNDRYINNMLSSIAPFWGGNQVWLILAAGGTFAAFPLIFSKMFTWLYLPMMMLLFGLIIRGLSIELLHNETEFKLRKIFKYGWFVGSLLTTVVLGLFFSNLFYGLLIGSNFSYYGTFFSLINKFTLFGVFLFSCFFILSGSLWLSFKTKGKMSLEYFKIAKKMSILNSINVVLYIISLFNIPNFSINYHEYIIYYTLPILCILSSILIVYLLNKCNESYNIRMTSFLLNCTTILFLMFTGSITLHPYILKSIIDVVYGVSIYISSSSDLTLFIMLVSALLFVPIVIAYQLWTYTLFSEKID